MTTTTLTKLASISKPPFDSANRATGAKVASTLREVAVQRAEDLAILLPTGGSVLELCVGPSFRVLREAYQSVGLVCFGNDIDPRWHNGERLWRAGDALTVSYAGMQAVVFAPPLSKGCSGTREDALSIDTVHPSYTAFLQRWRATPTQLAVLVLPGRSDRTREDRRQFHALLATLPDAELRPRCVGGVQKYIDVLIKNA